MVAWAAVEALKLGIAHEHDGQEVRARWPLGRLAKGIKMGATTAKRRKGKERRTNKLRKGVATEE